MLRQQPPSGPPLARTQSLPATETHVIRASLASGLRWEEAPPVSPPSRLLRKVVVGRAGLVWAMDIEGALLRLAPKVPTHPSLPRSLSRPIPVPRPAVEYVGAAADSPERFPLEWEWAPVDGLRARDIALGADGTAFALDASEGRVWQYANETLRIRCVRAKLREMRQLSKSRPVLLPLPTPRTSGGAPIDPDTSDGIEEGNPAELATLHDGGSWVAIKGMRFARCAVGSADFVAAIDEHGALWTYVGRDAWCLCESLEGTALTDISVGADGFALACTREGTILQGDLTPTMEERVTALCNLAAEMRLTQVTPAVGLPLSLKERSQTQLRLPMAPAVKSTPPPLPSPPQRHFISPAGPPAGVLARMRALPSTCASWELPNAPQREGGNEGVARQ